MSHQETTSDSSEKVVLHVSYPLLRRHTLVQMARARELQDDGNEVVLTYCNATSGTCAVNFSGSPLACAICRSRVRETANANGLTAVPLEIQGPDSVLSPSEKQEIAEGVHSAVISTFRQLPHDGAETPINRIIKRRYFQTACGLLRSMKQLLSSESPDRVEVFNGRLACAKFCLTAANRFGIPFNTMEVTGKAKPILFKGHTAHDRFRIQERMRTMPIDMEAAKRYFENRRRPAVNKFTRGYSDDFTPPDGSGYNRKISVFLSSQDEFEALGKAWKSPLHNYAAVMHEACVKNPDYLFCIRFHPNQADMISDVRTPFEAIGQLPNVIIYYPTDPANSYTLIEWSDVVLTFGSTVTVEACWAGKPAIMLGPSFYDQLDVSVNPANMDEFLEVIRQDMEPRPARNAAFAAMYMEYECDEFRYIGHDGRTMVSNGIPIKRALLSRVARSCDNAFCRIVKSYSKWYVTRKMASRSAGDKYRQASDDVSASNSQVSPSELPDAEAA